MDNQQGLIVCHKEPYSKLCGSLHGRGMWGRATAWVCTAESFAFHLKTYHNTDNQLYSDTK